ncbi:MAG: ATP-binding cassette domain-containing protein [Cryomorphaceae bacterium]|nr:ATP-binding cassette domain-containing protein [Cryomorphaceae bacterium]
MLGIIGRNGAGKSTLLKILSKVTSPTKGNIKVKGRIASLLEVGTGFHPELTGRENIFLNGAILGMTKSEIRSKFDEIVAFSGVEKYIDTPVKRYSSGMYVRLAFAVAAHLEPEILIVDEVLAVGDAEFQKKCLGKMKDVSVEGRTVLFVSHNMAAINQLCENSVLLERGLIKSVGKTSNIVNSYLLRQQEKSNHFLNQNKNKSCFFKEAFTFDNDNTLKNEFSSDEDINLRLLIKQNEVYKDLTVSIALIDKFGNRVFTQLKMIDDFIQLKNRYLINFKIPKNFIAPNLYSFHFALYYPKGEIYDIHDFECPIKVFDNGTEFIIYEGNDYGSIIMNFETNIELVEDEEVS